MTRAALWLVVAGGLASLTAATPQQPPPSPPPQQQPPVFRSGVETVAIYATVVDRNGELVTNLPRNAFKVFDNGMRQDVTVFVNALQPITAIMLVDTSASMAPTLDFARAAAEAFVVRMMPGDQARVGSFSDRIDVSREFTGDRDALLRALRNDLHIGNPTRLWDALDQTMAELSPLGGRRVIVLLTDGIDTYSTTQVTGIFERARSDELMIYAIHIRSRVRPGIEAMISPRASAPDPRRSLPPGEGLRRLALQTGGGYFVLNPTDDVNATFTRVAYELHHQYVLGFSPEKLDGRIHNLDVRVADPTMTVRARQNYLATRRAQGQRPTAREEHR
jgi:Ca-activated chloride channel family protein